MRGPHYDTPVSLEFFDVHGEVGNLTVRATYEMFVVTDRMDGRPGYAVTHGPTTYYISKVACFEEACRLADIFSDDDWWWSLRPESFRFDCFGRAQFLEPETERAAMSRYHAVMKIFASNQRRAESKGA